MVKKKSERKYVIGIVFTLLFVVVTLLSIIVLAKYAITDNSSTATKQEKVLNSSSLKVAPIDTDNETTQRDILSVVSSALEVGAGFDKDFTLANDGQSKIIDQVSKGDYSSIPKKLMDKLYVSKDFANTPTAAAAIKAFTTSGAMIKKFGGDFKTTNPNTIIEFDAATASAHVPLNVFFTTGHTELYLTLYHFSDGWKIDVGDLYRESIVVNSVIDQKK